MTRFEAFMADKRKLATILAKKYNICGQCDADRKICNAEANQNCALQYLDGELGSDFKCNYQKTR